MAYLLYATSLLSTARLETRRTESSRKAFTASEYMSNSMKRHETDKRQTPKSIFVRLIKFVEDPRAKDVPGTLHGTDKAYNTTKVPVFLIWVVYINHCRWLPTVAYQVVVITSTKYPNDSEIQLLYHQRSVAFSSFSAYFVRSI